MDPQSLRDRIASIAKPLDAIEVSGDLTPELRARIAAALEAAAAEAEGGVVPAARASEDPGARDEAARLFRRLAQTNSWLDGRESRTREWIDRAAELAASDVLRDMVVSEQNRLRDTEAFAGIRELCQQGLVDKARRTLKARRKRTDDPVMKKRIDEALAEPRSFLAPLKGAPTMTTINGLGTMLVGERDRRGDGTYVATLCLVFIFVPILPIRSYLVRQESQGWSFFGRVPLSPFAFWWRRIVVIGPLLLALAAWGLEAWETSPTVTEGRLLSKAGESLARRDYAGTLRTLQPMSGTRDAGRAERMAGLARSAFKAALADVKGPPDAEFFLRSVGGIPPRLLPSWTDGETAAAAEAALDRLSAARAPGKTVRLFLEWMGSMSPAFAARLPELAARASERVDDVTLLAATADLHVRAGRPCPPALLSRLSAHLLGVRHDTWDADALSYLGAAGPSGAQPVLLARAESAWKGDAPGPELLIFKGLPGLLRALLALDAEADLEKRAAGLEGLAAPAGLAEAQETWHRLGVARRLAKLYGALNEKDPIRFPVSKAHPWAVRAAELAPEDGGARVTALRFLVQDGDFARAVSLGSAHLRDPKTALWVGVAHARSGKPEEGAKLLRPIVELHLPEFARAFGEWEKTVSTKTEDLWRSLQKGNADRSVIKWLNSLSKERATEEAEKWVRQQVERDFRVADLARQWRDRKDVHPAASELAMIELGLGRSLPPGPERQARLQEAERLFLELRKVLHDDPHQELQLGQVYFWLGKEKEGAEIFDRLEASGDAPLLSQMGEIYRELSRMESARRVLEKAYEKAEARQKAGAAMARSLAADSSEDKLLWLGRGDTSNPRIRAELDQTGAELAMQRGEHAGAVEPLRRALAFYSGQPESAGALNNTALLQMDLARATGDLKPVLEALNLLRRAHESALENGIILGNYVDILEDVGVAALARDALRADLLHEIPSRTWFGFIRPQPTPAEWAERAKAQPELRRAADLGARVVVLSPDSGIGYRAQSRFFSLLRDGDAFRRLRESVESSPPGRQEAASLVRRQAAGEHTESERKALERQRAKWDALLPGLRKAGHAPTLAYALVQSAGLRLASVHRGVPGETIDAALREAEEAVNVFDAYPTRSALSWMRMELAAQGVAAADPEFARWVKESPGVTPALLLALYGRKQPDRAREIWSREDVRGAVLAAADLVRFPERKPWLWSWAWLELAGHPSREAAGLAFRGDPTYLESHRLDRLLAPDSPSEEAEAYLAAEACGEKELARKIAEGARAAGVLPLFFGE